MRILIKFQYSVETHISPDFLHTYKKEVSHISFMNAIKIKDRMSTPVQTINVDNTIQEAAKLMQSKKMGSLIVIDDGEHKGMLTERDIVYAVADGAEDTNLDNYMNIPLITIEENSPLGDAAQLMLTKNIRRLAVVDDNEKITGIINIRDLTNAVHESFLALFDA